VAAFAVSGYACTAGRTLKPFNPLERETYALHAAERRFTFLAEKTKHHPPVLAWHAQSDDAGAPGSAAPRWRASGCACLTPRFWGRRLELRPSGGCAVRFGGGGGDDGEEEEEEVFTWNKVTTLVSNLILGPLAVAHAGTMRVRSSATGAVWPLRFKDSLPPASATIGGKDAASSSSSFASSGAGVVVHGALEPGGAVIAGSWWGGLTLEVPPPSAAGGGGGTASAQHVTQLWRRSGAPADGRAGEEYHWSAFASGLNELPPPSAAATSLAAPAASGDAASLDLVCPTDSRLRPDQRLLELGRYAEANAAKQRLEERQRSARQRRTAPPPPRWFRPAPPPLGATAQQGGGGAGDELWFEFTGGYWEAHAARQGWGDVPRIFE
jgi:hypothetical protein